MSVLTGVRFGARAANWVHGYGYAIAFVPEDRMRAMAVLGPSPRACDVFAWFEDGKLKRNNWEQLHVQSVRDGMELLVSDEYVYGIYNLLDLFGARRMFGKLRIFGDLPNRKDLRRLQSTDLYAAVVQLPDLTQEGYCYVKLFQAKFSYRLAEAFGKFPKVSHLLKSVNPTWMATTEELAGLRLRVKDDVVHIDDVEGVSLHDVDWQQYSECVIGGEVTYVDQVPYKSVYARCNLASRCAYCLARARKIHVSEWNYDFAGHGYAVPPDKRVQQRIQLREILSGEERFKRGEGRMTVGIVSGKRNFGKELEAPLTRDVVQAKSGGYAYALQGEISLSSQRVNYRFPDIGKHVTAYFPLGSVIEVQGVVITAVTGPVALVMHGEVELALRGSDHNFVWCVLRDHAHAMRWNHRLMNFDLSSSSARLWERVGLPPLFAHFDQATVMNVHLSQVTGKLRKPSSHGDKVWGWTDDGWEHARIGKSRGMHFDTVLDEFPKPLSADAYVYDATTGGYNSDTGWLPRPYLGAAFVNCARHVGHSTGLWIGNVCVERHKSLFALFPVAWDERDETQLPMLLEKALYGSGSVLAVTSYDTYDLDDGGLSYSDGWHSPVLD